MYAAIRLITILSSNSWKEIFQRISSVYQAPEIRIPTRNKDKIMDKLKFHVKSSNIAFDATDGIKVSTDDGWWLIRAANTEEKIVVCCEGKDKRKLTKIRSKLNLILDHLKQD